MPTELEGAGGVAAGLAAGGNAVADEGQGQGGQTPGGASISADDGGGAGGQAGGEQWESGELPGNHWARANGVTTWGQLDQRYRSSSDESRRNAGLVEQYQQRMADMLWDQRRAGGQNGGGRQTAAGGQQQPAQGGMFGFGSREAYAAGMQADPEGTLDKVFLHRLENNPEFAKRIQRLVAPTLEPLTEQLTQQQEQEYMRRCGAQWQEFGKAWPDYFDGGPQAQQFRQYCESRPSLADFIRKDPLNGWQMAAAALDREVKAQQLKASEGKLAETRGRSGSARVGAGTPSAAKAGSFEENIRAKAAQSAAEGRPVSEDDIQQVLAQGRQMGFMRGKK